MKTAKKALALLLAVLMCASLFTTMAFADDEHGLFPSREPTQVKILSIGTNVDGTDKYPYKAAAQLQYLAGSSIKVFLQTLDQGKDSFMTASLLRTILTEGAYYDESSKYNQKMAQQYFEGDMSAENLKDAHDKFVNAMRGNAYKYIFGKEVTDIGDKYSSIITVDLVNASLTPYLMARLTAMMQNPKLMDTDEFIYDTPAKVHDQAVTGSGDMLDLLLENLYTEAFSSLDKKYQNLVKSICNAVSYTVFNFYADLKQDIEYIKWVNPLAKLVLVGGYNDLEGLKIKVDEDVAIDFGSFWASVISIVNAVICNDEHSAAYQFADLTTNRYVETRYGSILNAAQEAKDLEKNYNASVEEGDPLVFVKTDAAAVDAGLAAAIQGMVGAKIFENAKGLAKEVDWDSLTEVEKEKYVTAAKEIFEKTLGITVEDAQDNLLQAFADAGKVNKLDVAAIDSLELDDVTLAMLLGYKSPEYYGNRTQLSDGTATALNLYARFMLLDGYGLQPSNKAQTEIGEAVFQAIWELENASMKGEDVTITIFDNIFGGILNTFRTPILDTINQVFNNMVHGVADWFSNFFANLKDGIFNFRK